MLMIKVIITGCKTYVLIAACLRLDRMETITSE